MKITDVIARRLKVRETVGELIPAWPGSMMTFRRGGGGFVEIMTDAGLSGIGPAVDTATVSTAKEILIGANPFDVERHAEKLAHHARGRVYGGAAGYDIALWDLIGKASEQPLVSIFGGGDDAVTPYASLIQLSDPAERADLATGLKEEGWADVRRAVRFPAEKRRALRTLRSVAPVA